MFYLVAAVSAAAVSSEESKYGKSFSVLNVIRFPNTACQGTGSLNGTCYTSEECTSLSGTASGACASSFGVCCVFSLSCGGSTAANPSYAQISSYSTTSDSDPCIYKYCKNNADICKLRYKVKVNGIFCQILVSKELISTPWYWLDPRLSPRAIRTASIWVDVTQTPSQVET